MIDSVTIDEWLKGKVEYYISVSNRTQDIENARVRTIANDEIVIEFDTDDTLRAMQLYNRTVQRLIEDKIQFVVYNHNGRSPHIHIYNIIGLDSVEEELRVAYKKEFIEHYCSVWDTVYPEVDLSLTSNNHLIAREFMPHFKHNELKKVMFEYITDGLNNLSLVTLKKAQNRVESLSTYENIKDVKFDWFINFVLHNELPKGGRDMLIYKNIAILCTNHNLELNYFIDYICQYDIEARNQLRSWKKWSEKDSKFFSFFEVKRYFDEHDLDISEMMNKWKMKTF